MGNYCNGTATLTGDRDTLDLIYVLAQRLDDCAEVSKFDADTDWLQHIFKEEYSQDGIFYEGGEKNQDGSLELDIRASRTDGHEFFQGMASGLNLTIRWVYISDYDGREHKKTFKPKKGSLVWELRSEDELDNAIEGSLKADAQVSVGYDFLGTSYDSSGMSGLGRHLASGSSIGYMNLFGRSAVDGNNAKQTLTAHDDLAQEIYQHCLFAFILATRLHDNLNLIQRSRIAADIYIAAEATLRLVNHTFSTKQHIEKAEDIQFLAEYVDTMRRWFATPSTTLHYVAKIRENDPYDVVYGAYDYIKALLSAAMPNYAVQLAGLPLPEYLW